MGRLFSFTILLKHWPSWAGSFLFSTAEEFFNMPSVHRSPQVYCPCLRRLDIKFTNKGQEGVSFFFVLFTGNFTSHVTPVHI